MALGHLEAMYYGNVGFATDCFMWKQLLSVALCTLNMLALLSIDSSGKKLLLPNLSCQSPA